MKTTTLWASLFSGLIFIACSSDDMPSATGGGNTTGNVASVCEPGSARACYSGPAGTDGVGMCKGGTETCNAEGTGYGECTGEVAPTTEDCSSSADEDCDGKATCSGHVWSFRFGDADTQFVSGVAVDPQDAVVLTGQLAGSADFGGGALASAGSMDLFVAKLDASGKHAWSKRFGDAGSQTGMSIATDGQGNVIVAGYFDGTVDFGGGPLTSAGSIDIFVAKLDAQGNHVWSKRFGDAGPQAGTVVKATPAGEVVLVSALGGAVDFGGGPLTSAGGFDIGVVKLDADGNHVWSRRFGNETEQAANGLALDSAGNVLLTGMFLGTVDFGGGPLTDPDEGDVFVLKLNASGEHVWSKQFGAPGSQFGYEIAADKADNIIVAGTFFDDFDMGAGPLVNENDEDIFVAKLDPAGNVVFSRAFGDDAQQTVTGLAVDGDGNIVMTGSLDTDTGVDFGGGPLVSSGGSDALAVKFDGTGKTLWSLRFGDAPDQEGNDVAVDSAGNVLLAGVFLGSVDFGGGPLTTAGDYDLFIAKLGP